MGNTGKPGGNTALIAAGAAARRNLTSVARELEKQGSNYLARQVFKMADDISQIVVTAVPHNDDQKGSDNE